MTSCVLTLNSLRLRHMPSPGAVCAAIVQYGSVMFRGFFKSMSPDTANTMMRGSGARQAERKLPGPLSSRLVTTYTLPPLPPMVVEPNPSASGNARMGFCWQSTVKEINSSDKNIFIDVRLCSTIIPVLKVNMQKYIMAGDGKIKPTRFLLNTPVQFVLTHDHASNVQA